MCNQQLGMQTYNAFSLRTQQDVVMNRNSDEQLFDYWPMQL